MDFSNLFQQQDDEADNPSETMPNNIPNAVNSDKLAAYSKYLDKQNPSTEEMQKNFQNYIQNQNQKYDQASDIINRSALQPRTDAEQQFLDNNIDPITQSVMGGGAIGSIENLGANTASKFGKVLNAVSKGVDTAGELIPAAKSFGKVTVVPSAADLIAQKNANTVSPATQAYIDKMNKLTNK